MTRELTAPPVVTEIAERICKAHRIPLRSIVSKDRTAATSACRNAIWAEIRELRKPDGSHRFSFAAIGRFFNRDHSTVMHGVRLANAEAAAQARPRCSQAYPRPAA